MAIFKTEAELNEFMDEGIRLLMERYGMPESELARGEDFCRTLMAEYSRLLQQGKIKRPYTYSAERPDDSSIKFIAEQVIGGKATA